MERHVAGNILDNERTLKKILHLANPRSDVSNHFGRIWKRQQVVEIAPANSRPA